VHLFACLYDSDFHFWKSCRAYEFALPYSKIIVVS